MLPTIPDREKIESEAVASQLTEWPPANSPQVLGTSARMKTCRWLSP